MSSRKKATSNPLGNLFGGGRKRKGNLEDLIHQFIIQDPNVSAMKPESKPKNELKKVKKTPQEKETPVSKISTRSTRRNSEEIETEEWTKPKDRETPSKISSQTTRKSSGEIEADDGPMFPESPEDDWSPEKPTKKRASRAKKETSTTEKKPTKSRATTKSPGQPKKSRWDKYKNRDKNTPNAGGSVIRSAVMAEGDMEEEGMEGFLFDDNQPEDSYHENRLPYWLQEEHLKDDKGRGVNDEDYNPTTLSIPEIEFEKLTSIQKKFWEYKSKNFDKVVAFKMWTCYFFYGNDALLVHRLWDTRLGYYQGKIYSYCHEKPLFQMAPKLLDAGYQLMVIKQTDEYPKTKDVERVRDIFQVLTRGTYTENPGLTYNSQFCLCIYESGDNVGLAYFDTTTDEFYVGEFKDDENKNNLRTVLTKTKPAEVLYYKKYLSEETKNLLKTLPSKPVLTVQYLEDEQFKTLASVVDDISEMFSPSDESKPPMPDLLTVMKNAVMIELKYHIKNQKQPEEGKEAEKINEKEISHYFALKALNMCLNFLKELMLADNVFSMGTFHPYDLALDKKSTLYLDGQALQNLEVLEVEYGSTVSESRSLFGYMDKTVSGYGKRMFKKWLTSPLIDADAINQRLEAVEDLRDNPVITDFYQNGIKGLQDLERLIAKIYSLPNKKRISGLRFEEFVKNKLLDFLNILEQLEKVEAIITRFEPYIPKFKNTRLKQLVTFRDLENDDQVQKKGVNTRSRQKDQPLPGLFPKVGPILEELKSMVYVKEGLLVPAPGLNPEIDEILANIDRVKEKFQVILEKQRDFFKNRLLKYVHTKQRYELEVPDQVMDIKEKPRDYVVTSKRKGVVRYHTPEIEATLQELFGFEMDLQRALVVFMADYFRKFYDKKMYWDQIVACLAELDCLCSLAQFSKSMPFCCKPEVLPPGDKPIMELKDMVHPVIASQNPYFVPNDFIIEGNIDTFLITGPNMGGKSTLLRQICLAVIMAQVGSYVPASSFKLTVVDRIFTRIGASDRIVEGKSTFFIELEETFNILMEASRNSLVIIDELGRGTSTYDGVSIAYATLKYLAEYVRCITLFATHYHLLLEEFGLYDNVANYYMASEVDNEKEEIEFKYKFVEGQADKSHGIIIAKMAGIQQDVLDIAKEKSEFMTTEKRNIGFEKSLTDKFNKTIEELEKLGEAQGDSEFETIIQELEHLYH